MGLLQRTEKALQFSCVRIISFFFIVIDSSDVNNVVPQFLVNRFGKTCSERSLLTHILLSITVTNHLAEYTFRKMVLFHLQMIREVSIKSDKR